MLRCSEVTRLHASEDIQRASWRKRIAVRLHLMMCGSCQRYVKELAAIGVATRSMTRVKEEDPEQLEALLHRVLPDSSRSDR